MGTRYINERLLECHHVAQVLFKCFSSVVQVLLKCCSSVFKCFSSIFQEFVKCCSDGAKVLLSIIQLSQALENFVRTVIKNQVQFRNPLDPST